MQVQCVFVAVDIGDFGIAQHLAGQEPLEHIIQICLRRQQRLDDWPTILEAGIPKIASAFRFQTMTRRDQSMPRIATGEDCTTASSVLVGLLQRGDHALAVGDVADDQCKAGAAFSTSLET